MYTLLFLLNHKVSYDLTVLPCSICLNRIYRCNEAPFNDEYLSRLSSKNSIPMISLTIIMIQLKNNKAYIPIHRLMELHFTCAVFC